ncbi:recombinase XerC [Clostridium beijerinckii]|nr:recombinase XerC [Clostridium beijerinckii]
MNYDFDIFNNSKLPDSVVDFLTYLQTIKNKSENTIDAYKKDLIIFFRFMRKYKGLVKDDTIAFEEIEIVSIDDEFIKSIKLRDLYAFMSFIEKYRGNSSYARARKVATLKSYFKFLQGKAKIIVDNPTIELESPKVNKRHPIYLTLNQSLHLLESLDKKNKNYQRDYCILTLFLNCGMRLSELCNIQINKFKNDTLTIIGKGDKERTVYLNEASLKAIANYLKVRNDSKALSEDKKFLFLSSRNSPINQRTVEIMIKKHITNAGLTDEKYTPHKLRHTAATLMYKYGNVDIRSLQSILGHENISTTQIYTHVDDDSLRKAVESNPLSKL